MSDPTLAPIAISGAALPCPSPARSTFWRKFTAGCIVALGFAFLGALFSSTLTPQSAVSRDYIEYWVTGRQLVLHRNPYDLVEILNLERGAGMTDNTPKVSLSPPVGLFFSLPLGYLSPKTGLIAWLLAQIAALSLSFWLLWRLHGCPDSRYHLLGYLFAPAIACQMAGQLGNFFLLCLVLFLTFHKSRPWLAGAVLMPLALKPHLFLPVALVLICWAVLHRAYPLLLGYAGALVASCALSLHFDPNAWAHYRQMVALSNIFDQYVPSISLQLRLLVWPRAIWIQFAAEAATCLWALWYFWARRHRWVWAEHGFLVLLVAAVCTPYGWFYDDAILFPAVLAGIYRAVKCGRSLIPMAVLAGAALVETLAGVQLNTPWYLWTTPAWLGWYIYAFQADLPNA